MAKIKDYIPRLAENSLKRKLKSSGCVVVSGPKFCGKSTLCEEFAKSVTTLKTTNDIEIANADPYSTLKGDNPHLVDECHGSSKKEGDVYIVPISMLGL